MKIDPRFVFAHDKPSELEISFPGGSVRITAPDNSAEPYHAEIIVSPDEEFHLENIPYIRRGGDIIHIAPGPASVMYSRLDAPTVEEQREALSIDDTQALRRMFGNHMKEQIVTEEQALHLTGKAGVEIELDDDDFYFQKGDSVVWVSDRMDIFTPDGLAVVTILDGDFGKVLSYDPDGNVVVEWEKGATNAVDEGEIDRVEEDEDETE